MLGLQLRQGHPEKPIAVAGLDLVLVHQAGQLDIGAKLAKMAMIVITTSNSMRVNAWAVLVFIKESEKILRLCPKNVKPKIQPPKKGPAA